MVDISGWMTFFFAQIKEVLKIMLPAVWPMAIVGFLIYLAVKY